MKIYLISFFIATSIFSLSLFTSDFQQNESIVFHPESTELQYDEIQIKLYPNPVYDVAQIESNVELSRISILNAIGKTVMKETFEPAKKSIKSDLTDLAKGLYFIRFYGEDGNLLKTYKLLKYDSAS